MDLEVKEESSVAERIPPVLGEGKSWRLRNFEWFSLDPQDPTQEPLGATMILKNGMPVADQLRGQYWEARDTAVKAIATYREAGEDPPYSFGLFDLKNNFKGFGQFDRTDTADDMAWIACMYLEMGLRMAFSMPAPATVRIT